MKIAITGGAGFIGTALAKRLIADGHDPVLIDTAPSKTYPRNHVGIDICDLPALTKALQGTEAIFHLAAEHRDDVSPVQKYYNVNVTGGQNVIEAAKTNNIQTIIFTSTVAVYGLDAGASKETDTPAPFNDYGRSKLQSEQDFNTWAAQDPERKLVTLRLVATFGPGNRGNIYTLMQQIANGKFMMIGDGRNCKSIAYVENVAAFLQHCLSLPKGANLYNYADKPDLNMRNMVADIRAALGQNGTGPRLPFALGLLGGLGFDALAKITGRNFPISTIRVKKFCADTVVNADKLQETGFAPPASLQEGLRAMIEDEFLPQAENARKEA